MSELEVSLLVILIPVAAASALTFVILIGMVVSDILTTIRRNKHGK